jgi:hypothetical protein
MKKRIVFRNWKFYIALTRLRPVVGVNSKLEGGDHFLMWDFDNKGLEQVWTALEVQAMIWFLPDIYVLQSSDVRHYHAYCFYSASFERAAVIIGGTDHVDRMYHALALVRKYWTLRISAPDSQPFKPVGVIAGTVPPTVDLEILSPQTVEYLSGHTR